MERIQGINPQRIQWCCADRGTTPDELATAVGIPTASFDRVMSGDEGLTFPQLQRVAAFLNRGVLFFLEPGPVNEAKVYTPQFRTLTNQLPGLDYKIKTLIERVEKQRAVYLSLRADLGEADQPLFTPPALPLGEPKQAAEIAREWLGLTGEHVFDMYRQAVENRGVLVFRTNGYPGAWQIDKNSSVIGFSLFDENCPAIVVKKQVHEARQTFTLMHELGHLLLHRNSFIDQDEDLYSRKGNESVANAFAGYLLVPDVLLASVEDRGRPREVSEYEAWLKPISRKSGVSTEVILRRLLDTGRLSQGEYGAYREWARQLPLTSGESGSRAYRYREPRHIFGEPFVRTVFDALSARHITLAKASTYLDNLKISDVHQLEHHLAGV